MQPGFFTQYGNTGFPREKNYCPESDKLCSRCKKPFKSTQVRQRGQGRMMNKRWRKYHGRDAGRKETHVTAGLQGAWQIANRLSYRKKLTGTGIGFHFPIHTPCRAPSEQQTQCFSSKPVHNSPIPGMSILENLQLLQSLDQVPDQAFFTVLTQRRTFLPSELVYVLAFLTPAACALNIRKTRSLKTLLKQAP